MKNNNIISEIGQNNRLLARDSLYYFAKTYFPHYCKLSFAPFQLELFKALEEMTGARNKNFAAAVPRGYGKSSVISVIYVLWCICYGYERCIVLCSSTKELAEKMISHIKDELTGNRMLGQDFQDVCEPPNPRWRNDEIITKNGVNVITTSVGKKTRGIRYKEDRPGLLICDDCENYENVRSPEGRDKLLEWFTSVIMNLGNERANFIVTGTILHFGSLLSKLVTGDGFLGWDAMLKKAIISYPDNQYLWDQWVSIYGGRAPYQDQTGPKAAKSFYTDNKAAMLKGAAVLWPEKESYYDLMLIKQQRGEAAFMSEKMNEPKAYEPLDVKTLDYWDDSGRTLDDLKQDPHMKTASVGACDPAATIKPTSDYSAIVTGIWDMKSQVLYVTCAEAGRWELDTLAKRIILFHETHAFAKFTFESNGSQIWLGDELKKQCPMMPVEPLNSKEHKDTRIMRLIILIKQGRVKLSRKLSELIRQLSQYPFCEHDDLVDALALLILACQEVGVVGPEDMQKLFDRFRRPDGPSGRGVIGYGGYPFDDPTGLLRG